MEMGNELYHFNFKNSNKNPSPKKNFLYVAKVPLKNKTWRYFYDKAEYAAYLKGRQTKKEDVLKKPDQNNGNKNSDDDKKSKLDKLNELKNKLMNSKKTQDIRIKLDKTEARSKKFDALLGGKILSKTERSNIDNHLKVINPLYEKAKKGQLSSKDNYNYQNNCQSCAVAFDLRMRGYDVKSTPALKMNTDTSFVNISFAGNRHLGSDSVVDTVNITDSNGKQHSVEIHKQESSYLDLVYKDASKNIRMIEPSSPNKFASVDNDLNYSSSQDIQNYRDVSYQAMQQDLSKQEPGSYGVLMFDWESGSGHICNYYIADDSTVIMIDAQSGEKFDDIRPYYDKAKYVSWLETDDLSLNKDSAYLYAINKDIDYDNVPTYITKNTRKGYNE